MSDPIIQLRGEDFEEAMDFLNLVFSAHAPHDFARLLPLLYRPTDQHMSHNYAIRQGGRLRAIVGLFPLRWQVGQKVLRVAGIGGVSTHPNCRGAGLMQCLMQHCVRQMQAEGYPLSWLGGQRQRYGYFGYEKCGVSLSFSLNKSNLKHCFSGEPRLGFAPLGPQEGERLARARALHDAQAAHALRSPEDFHFHCLSWNHRPFVALDQGDRMAGYLVASGKGDYIAELVAESDEAAVEIARSWVAQKDQGITLDLSPVASGLARRLGQFCEGVSVRSSGNWQVFTWAEVVDDLLKLRRSSGPLAEGTVVVGIQGYGRIQLEVDGNQAGSALTDALADVECDAPTALRLLFGPLSPSQVMPLPARAALLESWCPLPLFWARQDGV